jgi:hypothetical protein
MPAARTSEAVRTTFFVLTAALRAPIAATTEFSVALPVLSAI